MEDVCTTLISHSHSNMILIYIYKFKNRLMRWRVDIQVLSGVILFILLHVSSGSGQYHTEDFTLNQTDVTQSQLLTAFNWIIMTILIYYTLWLLDIAYTALGGVLSRKGISANSNSGCRLWSSNSTWWTTEDVFRFTPATATVQTTGAQSKGSLVMWRGNRRFSVYFLSYDEKLWFVLG